MRRLLVLFAFVVIVVGGIGLFRAMQVKSRQLPPGTPSKIAVDGAKAAERLAGAIRIPTVSWGDVSRRDARALTLMREAGYARATV